MKNKIRNKIVIYTSILFLFATILIIAISSNAYAFPNDITIVGEKEDKDIIIEYGDVLESSTIDFTINVNKENREYYNTIIFTPTYIANNVLNSKITLKLEKLNNDVYELVEEKEITKDSINTSIVYIDKEKATDSKEYRMSLYVDNVLQDIKEENISGELRIKTYKNYYYDSSDELNELLIDKDGTYLFELWGPAINDLNGAYTKGTINLKNGDLFYISTSSTSSDIRLKNNEIDNDLSLNSRIMVAGQTGISTEGTFGLNGYYGTDEKGSSYISGHNGVNSILNDIDRTLKCSAESLSEECSIHYSNYYFTNTLMIDGEGYSWTNIKEEIPSNKIPDYENANAMFINGNPKKSNAKITLLTNGINEASSESVWKKERGKSTITVHYYLTGTTTKVKEDDVYTEEVGTPYEIKNAKIRGYVSSGTNNNETGVYTNDPIEIVYYYNEVKTKQIKVNKMILKDSIELQQKDISFTFKLVGENTTFYKEIIFDKSKITEYFNNYPEDEFIQESVVFDNLAVGNYKLYELLPDNYDCKGIINVKGGTIENEVILFDLNEEESEYTASFINSEIK